MQQRGPHSNISKPVKISYKKRLLFIFLFFFYLIKYKNPIRSYLLYNEHYLYERTVSLFKFKRVCITNQSRFFFKKVDVFIRKILPNLPNINYILHLCLNVYKSSHH